MKRPLILGPGSDLKDAAAVFRGGGVVAYPTETFYGLAVNPFDQRAVERLFSLKGRPEKNPVSVIIKDTDMLGRVAREVPPVARTLIKKFWPGPLTIIFDALPSIPAILLAGTGKIGARVSGSVVATRLSGSLDSPITATSANPSGKRPPVTAEEVLDYFRDSIDILIDGGTLAGRKGSTVIDITGGKTVIIREGEIPSSEIVKYIE